MDAPAAPAAVVQPSRLKALVEEALALEQRLAASEAGAIVTTPIEVPVSVTVPGQSPGLKTTEFWLAAGAVVLGVYLAVWGGKPEIGESLVSWAVGSYAGARALTKSGVIAQLLSAFKK